MDERIDAERPVRAGQSRLDAFDEIEAGPPHEGAIAEYPEVLGGVFQIGGEKGGQRGSDDGASAETPTSCTRLPQARRGSRRKQRDMQAAKGLGGRRNLETPQSAVCKI